MTTPDPATKRIPWFPSNGSEGAYLHTKLCQHCAKDRNEDCPIILRSITEDTHVIPEWTATDIYGRGLQCSEYEPHD